MRHLYIGHCEIFELRIREDVKTESDAKDDHEIKTKNKTIQNKTKQN